MLYKVRDWKRLTKQERYLLLVAVSTLQKSKGGLL